MASLKDQLVLVSQDYLGPAAERFIERQISTHLRKKPENILQNDVRKLIDWLKLSFALLTDDTDLVNEYADRLALVAEGKPEQALGNSWQS